MDHHLSAVVAVDASKCTNCHACIAVCPSKAALDATGDHVRIHHAACIGCGACLRACSHGARCPVDDTAAFVRDLAHGIPLVVFVSPAVAAVFPYQFLQLNGWLKSRGAAAVFDIGFGGELAARSYLHHLDTALPATIINASCPALVGYLELYRPELLPHLAPVDSPMIHAMKMVRQQYPAYGEHRFAAITPCVAARREMDATGIGEYNVTLQALRQHLADYRIALGSIEARDYDNPPAERAVTITKPGGLSRTMARWRPDLAEETRVISGPGTTYHYLDQLPAMLAQGIAPVMIDCLNCALGCNAGPGSGLDGHSPEAVEIPVEMRGRAMQARHRKRGLFAEARTRNALEATIARFWDAARYTRSYTSRAQQLATRVPSDVERLAIYVQMGKQSENDILNCNACGYGTCAAMAEAVYNGLNRPEHCRHFLKTHASRAYYAMEKLRQQRSIAMATIEQLRGLAYHVAATAEELSAVALVMQRSSAEVATGAEQLAKGVVEQSRTMHAVGDQIQRLQGMVDELAHGAHAHTLGAEQAARTTEIAAYEVQQIAASTTAVHHETRAAGQVAKTSAEMVQAAMHGITRVSDTTVGVIEQINTLGGTNARIRDMAETIDEMATHTRLLARYALEDAAGVGEPPPRSRAVADEVRKLADRVAAQARGIDTLSRDIQEGIVMLAGAMHEGNAMARDGATLTGMAGTAMEAIVVATEQVTALVSDVMNIAGHVEHHADEVRRAAESLAASSEESRSSIARIGVTSSEVAEALRGVGTLHEESSSVSEQLTFAADEQRRATNDIGETAGRLASIAQQAHQLLRDFSERVEGISTDITELPILLGSRHDNEV